MNNKVYAVPCPAYEDADEKLSTLIGMLGGMSQFVRSEEKIVLKVNLLQGAAPEKAVTTHPKVVAAAGRLVKKAAAVPLIVDSPGAGLPYNEKTLDRVYRISGMHQAAQEAGMAVNFDAGYQTIKYPQGKLLKHFEMITPVIQANGVLNLCKFKTHTLMSMTGAVKNIFGVIPGYAKPGYHALMQQKAQFADMLLDLAAYVSPRLSIMDAVVGMEGNGPNSGSPRKVGWLLAAANPLALDVVAAEMMGLSREYNPLLMAAQQRGMQPNRIEDVQLIGADIARMRVPDFKLPSTLTREDHSGLLALLLPLFKNVSTRRPHVDPAKCIACGQCFKACPVEAITMDEVACINNSKCIRCYCCHEMCSEEAIDLQAGVLYRLTHRQK
ncbi:MAG: 4Fe-4S ferredoxin [Deltaproteobacteria bacterium HGW-Deltaproteobacteria-13]|jgi:uncharacterized protein (DUF362 family)/NAD-dependent dihydropyrimidine dehydrogenase PreA subunit|nr:MAG: 4Fe-4S ferredoxin [Deltaproteobacteria bacterium HGW-Deltaproteobacteria-13]